jgi:hypothetical protein
MVALRATPPDQTRILQHVEMMGEQVSGHLSGGSELLHRAIAFHEEVDDVQSRYIPERRMDLCSLTDVH